MGGRYEEKAAEFLRNQGAVILEQNFRCRSGEIDLIARDGKYLVFVEVKYRSGRNSGYASAAVDWHKQKQICRTAQFYLLRHGIGDVPCRFDVIAIDGDHLEWIKNAFLFQG